MAEKPVVWSGTAAKQKREILHYWVVCNGSKVYSEKLAGLIRQRVRVISQKPFSGKSTELADIREATLGDYSIFYKVTDVQIAIITFWDNRQNPKKLLEILKNQKT